MENPDDNGKGLGRDSERKSPANPRELAFRILRRVHRKGAYLNLVLRYGMPVGEMEPRDRALVSELCFGVERYRNALDHGISRLSTRSLRRIHPDLLDFLRIGLYQIMYTDVPPHAAVHETVEAAKSYLHRGNLGFLNALLRRAVEDPGALALPGEEDPAQYMEITLSFPRWLVEYLQERYPVQEAIELLRAQNRRTGLTLRCNPRSTDPLSLLRLVEERGGKGRPSAVLEDALEEVEISFEALLELIQRGLCLVQDLSSMAACLVVDPRGNMRIIDACAAPGGKTSYLAQRGGPECEVVAVDINASRLKALERTMKLMGLQNVRLLRGDARRLREVAGDADAVLVDAPCSGLGTLARNPDLKWRRSPQDLIRMRDLQLDILMGSADAVRRGGVLVYSVCTYTDEETTQVTREFLRRSPGFVSEDLRLLLPQAWRKHAGNGAIQLMPHLHGTEGMYIARFRRLK